jgi:hypothetical protein
MLHSVVTLFVGGLQPAYYTFEIGQGLSPGQQGHITINGKSLDDERGLPILFESGQAALKHVLTNVIPKGMLPGMGRATHATITVQDVHRKGDDFLSFTVDEDGDTDPDEEKFFWGVYMSTNDLLFGSLPDFETAVRRALEQIVKILVPEGVRS